MSSGIHEQQHCCNKPAIKPGISLEAGTRVLAVYSKVPAPPNTKINFQTNFPCLINLGKSFTLKKTYKSLQFLYMKALDLKTHQSWNKKFRNFLKQLNPSVETKDEWHPHFKSFLCTKKFPLLIIILNARNYQPEKMILQNKVRKKLGYFRVTFGIMNLSKTGSNLEVCLAHNYILLKPNQAFLGSYICTTS